MAITQAMCNSFKLLALDATKTYKIALFTSAVTLSKATTAYSTTNEVVGTGYTAGGKTISATSVLDGDVAIMDFPDTTWTTATITARGAMIYESAAGNPAVAVYDFGSDKTSTASDFVVEFPAAAAATAVVRIA